MQEDSTNIIENEESFYPPAVLNNSWCSEAKELPMMKNPFLDRHKTSFPDFNSPSVFRFQPTPVTSSKPFQWSVEEIAILRPADIDELPNQEVVDNSYFMTPRRAEASTKFFSMKNAIPILMTPTTRFVNRTNVNSTLKLDSPNPYSFSHPPPPEMLEGTATPIPSRTKSPMHARAIDTALATVNSKPAAAHSLARSCTSIQSQRKAAVECGVQTTVSLPLDFDLGKVLSGCVLNQGEDNANAPSIRRILFSHPISQTHDSASPVDTLPSPILQSKSPTARVHSLPSSASPVLHPNRRVLMECPATWSPPVSRSNSTQSLPPQTCPESEPLLDLQETPKTTKRINYSSKLQKSRRERKMSIKRHPVSPIEITPTTPGSLLLSLTSGKFECSNIHSPISDLPCVSPITSQVAAVNSEGEESPGVCSTPKPASEHDSSHQSHQPIPMSPITYCNSSLQTLPSTYESTSTPLVEPTIPPSRRLTVLPILSSPAACSADPPPLQESPWRSPERGGALDSCRGENAMQEDPAPLLQSDNSSAPDKLLVTQSLEGDSGIGSSYGEQSSLFHTQYKNRLKQRNNGDHQLSFSYSQENMSENRTHQSPTDNSLSSEQVTKMRAKRNCVKFDSSPLSIVRHPLNDSQEPKRYQLDSTGLDYFQTPPSPAQVDISNLDPIFPAPGMLQQQAKQIETIGKLRNFNKWNTHKKNIELRTSNPINSHRFPHSLPVSPNQ